MRRTDMAARTAREKGWLMTLRYQLTFNTFIRMGNFVRMMRYLPEVSPRYWPRLMLMLMSSLLTLPLRLAETVIWGRRIARTRITQPPIFIIGHWRSGTTHLHNLFSQDRTLGFVSMYQAIAPDCSLIGGAWLKRLIARVLPAQRPMDNMVWPIDSPQEEEVALGKMCPWSFYAQFMFPRHARDFFSRHVLLDGSTPRVERELRTGYQRILRVATIHADGRRLVLKNPINTARIGMLREMFPDAKFIHIHRSPYEVYSSTRNLHGRITAFTTLQELDGQGSAETVFTLYDGMMKRFLAERDLIPAGNLAEVRFDDLERDPVGEMRRLYDTLSLPGFAAMEPALRDYVAGLAGYRKNSFTLPDADRVSIEARWGFAFQALGYAPAGGD